MTWTIRIETDKGGSIVVRASDAAGMRGAKAMLSELGRDDLMPLLDEGCEVVAE